MAASTPVAPPLDAARRAGGGAQSGHGRRRSPGRGGAPPGGTIGWRRYVLGASRTRRRIVLDPEDGWIGVRRNQGRIDRRRRIRHVADLGRLVAVLDEDGSVRRA